MRSCLLLLLTCCTAFAFAQGPTTASMTPDRDAADVISIFSDAYTDAPVDTYLTGWSNSGLTDTVAGGDSVLRYENLTFAGIETVMNPIDLMAAGMTHLHLDYWSPNVTNFRMKLVDFGGTGFDPQSDNTEAEIGMDLAQGEWVSVDYPLSDFAGMNQSDINQFVISADPGGSSIVYLDNIYFYADNTGTPTAPTSAAPTPMEAAENVISVFSGAYDGVSVDTYLTGWSNSGLTDTVAGGDSVLRYDNLTFAGIETVMNPIDLEAAGMTHLHVDLWTPNVTNFRMKLVDFGGTGFDPQDDNTEFEIGMDVAQGTWVSIDYPLTDFTGMNQSDINQFVISSDPAGTSVLYLDNVYFYKEGDVTTPTAPLSAAPTPTAAAEDVISLFSGAYDDVAVDTYLTSWSNSGLTDTVAGGDSVLRYDNLTFAGIETVMNPIDLTAAGMTHLHVDLWTPNVTAFRTKLVDFGGTGFDPQDDNTEFEIGMDVAQGTWVSIDYPLTDFMGMNQSDINQIVISSDPAGTSVLYLDNVYFYKASAQLAQMKLPVTFDEDGVDYGLADFGGNESMIVEDPTDASNTVAQSTKTTGAMTWGGTTLTSTSGGPDGFAEVIPFTEDASIITVRVWSPTAGTPVLLKAEKADDATVSVETLTNTTVAMAWDTLTFDFKNEAPGTAAINYDTTYNKLSIFFNFGTSPTADETYFWDDLIFTGTTGDGGGNPVEPMVAAPTPTREAATVISMFSDAYTNVAVDTWRTDWSNATFEDVQIAGDSTKKYSALVFAGIETVGSPINLEAPGMTHLHVDYWTADLDVFRIKLVDFGMDGFMGDNADTEKELEFATTKGEWVSLDIPLEDFSGMNQSDINQFIISGAPAGTVFLDNVYYYNNEPDGVNTPVTGLLEVFPNPVSDLVRVTAPEQMKELILYGVDGRYVGSWAPNNNQFDLDMSQQKPGLYVALVRTDNGLLTVKLLKE